MNLPFQRIRFASPLLCLGLVSCAFVPNVEQPAFESKVPQELTLQKVWTYSAALEQSYRNKLAEYRTTKRGTRQLLFGAGIVAGLSAIAGGPRGLTAGAGAAAGTGYAGSTLFVPDALPAVYQAAINATACVRRVIGPAILARDAIAVHLQTFPNQLADARSALAGHKKAFALASLSPLQKNELADARAQVDQDIEVLVELLAQVDLLGPAQAALGLSALDALDAVYGATDQRLEELSPTLDAILDAPARVVSTGGNLLQGVRTADATRRSLSAAKPKPNGTTESAKESTAQGQAELAIYEADLAAHKALHRRLEQRNKELIGLLHTALARDDQGVPLAPLCTPKFSEPGMISISPTSAVTIAKGGRTTLLVSGGTAPYSAVWTGEVPTEILVNLIEGQNHRLEIIARDGLPANFEYALQIVDRSGKSGPLVTVKPMKPPAPAPTPSE